jgi:site-specific DNA-cytosine methylase
MRILIACEYSAVVRDAFRALGHDAWSCDIEPTEGDPRWHITGDALEAAYGRPWDVMVAFPPCTHLSKAGARWWPAKQADGRQAAAAQFVYDLWAAPIERVAIENPVGWLNTNWQTATQTVQPFEHGDPWRKTTCLWLRGLPRLVPTAVVEPLGLWVDGDGKRSEAKPGGRHRNPRERSRTFAGIARAMATQWGRPGQM